MNATALLKPTNVLLNSLLRSAMLDAVDVSTKGGLFGSQIGLVKGYPGFSPALLAADIQEADYDGYQRIALGWLGVSMDSGGRVSVKANSVNFAPTDSNVSEGIRGVALFDAHTGGNLLAIGVFTAQFVFARPTDVLSVVTTISLPPATHGDWGNAVGVR